MTYKKQIKKKSKTNRKKAEDHLLSNETFEHNRVMTGIDY